MMKIDVLNLKGEKVNTADLPASIFEAPIKQELMHQALVRQMANARLGTHKTKSRGEVSGGGRKPWRQKGTGRARHGSIRSPIWVGGGKVHSPRPRSYDKRMPKKMRRAALRSALSVKAAAKEIIVVDEFTMAAPKTKDLLQIIADLAGGADALILLPERERNVEKSARNLAEAKTLRAEYLNIRDLLKFGRVIIPLASLEVVKSFLAESGANS
jgi:large subunit ribosomal protein L4